MEDNGPENISFKNPEQIRFMDKDVFRISTEYPIKIRKSLITKEDQISRFTRKENMLKECY